MNRLIPIWAVCTLLAASGASVARAQSQAPAPSASGQDQDSASASPSSSAPQKKVWTNDDMGAVHSDPAVSGYQPKGKNGGNKQGAAQSKPQAHDASWYRQQIDKLQQQIPPIDAKLAELQKGVSGETVNDPTTSSRPVGVHAGSWQQQIDELQSKREGILEKISALEDQARHAGISPNDIP